MDKLLKLEARGGSALSKLVDDHEREVVTISGNRSFVVLARAFWDTRPNDSDLYVEVSVSPSGYMLKSKMKSGLVVDPYTSEITRYASCPQAPGSS